MSGQEVVIHGDLLVRLEKGGAATAVLLDLSSRPDLTLDQFESICVFVGRLEAAVKWYAGDLVIQGETLFGECVYQALEALNMSSEGRQECARVASAIPPHRRRAGLSWSHHRAVARRSITPRQRDALLDQAERERLTANELYERVKELCDGSPLPGKDRDADCEAVLDELARRARADLVACGYPSDLVVEIAVRAPGVEVIESLGRSS